MANWLHQLQSLLGQQGASPSGESSKGSGLLPGAIGGLAGLLVASKSSRKLLAKYGTSALEMDDVQRDTMAMWLAERKEALQHILRVGRLPEQET
ncbi:hypothetical protein V6699_22180, partial [Klebsiella pneumoniae]